MNKTKKIAIYMAVGLLALLMGYCTYVFIAYDRLEDRIPLTVETAIETEAETERLYTVVTYNLGFGAYSADYSFFMC